MFCFSSSFIEILLTYSPIWGSLLAQLVNNLPANEGDIGDAGSIPGSGRSPGEGNGNPSILAWRIPWTEEPGGLQSMGSQRVRHD